MKLTKVKNVNHRFGKDSHYYHANDVDFNVSLWGDKITGDVLFSEHQVNLALRKAYKNREDLPVADGWWVRLRAWAGI